MCLTEDRETGVAIIFYSSHLVVMIIDYVLFSIID